MKTQVTLLILLLSLPAWAQELKPLVKVDSVSPIIVGAVIGGIVGGVHASKSGDYSLAGGIWRGALIGGLAGATGADNAASVVDGLVNLSFEAFGTTATSAASNILTGQRWDSRLDIGVGDFSLHFRNGKLSKNLIDNLDNIASLYSYSLGFIDVAMGYSTVRLDNSTFSPQFSVSYKSMMVSSATEENPTGSFRGLTFSTLNKNRAGALNENGAQFYGYVPKGKKIFNLHEQYHSIDTRLKGRFSDGIYYYLLYKNKVNHHDSQYEKRIIKWAGY